MSLTATLFGAGASATEDAFEKRPVTIVPGTEDETTTEKKSGEKKKVGKKGEKRVRDNEDSTEEAQPSAEEISNAFSKNKKVDDLFKLQPAGVRESRREKVVREVDTREKESKEQGKKLTPHERLKKKHLSHAVDRHDDEDVRTVFVGNLPNDVDKRKVMAYFKDCGEIENARIRCQTLTRQETKERGRAVRVLRKEFETGEEYSATAYVLFKRRDSVAKAVQKSGMVFMDRHINVSEENAVSKAFDPKTSAFLGNLSYDTSDEQVWRFFADNGITDVRRIRIVRDRDSGRNKGIGYAEFSSPASCNTAIALRGKEINGREVRMCHVQKSKDPAIAKLQSSRRDARKATTKGAKKSGPLKNGQTADQTRKVVVKEEMPSWMGTVTNARKKLARDLRPLIPNNVVLSREQKKKKNAIAYQKAGTKTPTHGWDDGK